METPRPSPHSEAENSRYRMIDVGPKQPTDRVALAAGEITLSPKTLAMVVDGTLPKGDALALAEVAGIHGAKQTAALLPLCHPLALDSVRVWHRVDSGAGRIEMFCEVSAHAKTGVEMEAMCGVQSALLCLYDLTKAFERGSVLSEIRLLRKSGGKSGEWMREAAPAQEAPAAPVASLQGVRVSVITVSDRTSRGETSDRSGPAVSARCAALGAEIVECAVVPDEIDRIRETVKRFVRESRIVFLTGGTGLGPRDVTPEAVRPLFDRELPGFGELLRARGMLSTPSAWLSRATAGQVGSALVAALPGSPKAVEEAFDAVGPQLAHILSIMRGGGHG